MIPKLDISKSITVALRELEQNTPLTDTSRGSTVRSIVETVAGVNHRYARDVLSMLSLRMLSSSTGSGLDIIGDILGIRRRAQSSAQAKASERICRFYSSRGTFGSIHSASFIIPVGTQVFLREYTEGSTSNIVRITQQVLCSSTESEAWFSCESELPGANGTIGKGAMVGHSFSAYDDVQNNSLRVENVSPIIGENMESDDMYRSRIANERHRRGGANGLAIELAAMSVPGIANATLIGFEAGAGTSTCLITSTTGRAGPALLAKAAQAVRTLENPFSQTITIDEPSYLGVELATRVKFRTGTTGDQKVVALRNAERVVRRMVGDIPMGSSVSINSISAAITSAMRPHVSDVGLPGTPIEEYWLWKETQDGRRYRNKIYGNYTAGFGERIIIEDSITSPIRILEWQ